MLDARGSQQNDQGRAHECRDRTQHRYTPESRATPARSQTETEPTRGSSGNPFAARSTTRLPGSQKEARLCWTETATRSAKDFLRVATQDVKSWTRNVSSLQFQTHFLNKHKQDQTLSQALLSFFFLHRVLCRPLVLRHFSVTVLPLSFPFPKILRKKTQS